VALSRRTLLVRAVQLGIALFVIVAAFDALEGQWGEARRVADDVRLDWGILTMASAIVVAAYLVLVATWRAVVNGMGGRLRYADAAYIWFVSAIARYAGALWQVFAMSALSQRLGAPPVVAAGAAVVTTIVSVLTGFGVLLATGAAAAGDIGARGYTVLALGILALALAPFIARPASALAARVTGRAIELPRLTSRALAAAAIGSIVSWFAYGTAFWLLTAAVLGDAPGGWLVYVSVYTTAYLAGYLALVPAGIGVAEGAMVGAFALAGVLSPAEALTVAVVSRLWRTVMEILPGVVLLVVRGRPQATLRTNAGERDG